MRLIPTRITATVLTVASALSMPAQIALASPRVPPRASLRDHALTLAIAPVVASSVDSFAPAALVPLTALALEDQRAIITGQLIDLGREAGEAQSMAAELTADDLTVLLANPKMMRKAGEIDVIIWALIIAGVIVALVIASDGSISVNT